MQSQAIDNKSPTSFVIKSRAGVPTVEPAVLRGWNFKLSRLGLANCTTQPSLLSEFDRSKSDHQTVKVTTRLENRLERE